MQHAAVDVVELAVEVDLAVAQQRPDDGEGLFEPTDSLVVCEAEGVVFSPVPAGAEPEDQPSLRDRVDGGRLFRKHRRCVETGAGDERPDLDPFSRGGDRSEGCPCFPWASGTVGQVVDEMIANPDRVEPGLLRGTCHCEVFGERDFPLHLR